MGGRDGERREGRGRERESQIHVRICYDLWVLATVAKNKDCIYNNYLLTEKKNP